MRWFQNGMTELGGEEQFLWLLLLQDWLAGDPAAAGMLLGRRTGRRGVGRYRAPQNWVLFYRV